MNTTDPSAMTGTDFLEILSQQPPGINEDFLTAVSKNIGPILEDIDRQFPGDENAIRRAMELWARTAGPGADRHPANIALPARVTPILKGAQT